MSDVVKIDEELLKKVKKLVNTKENRIKYSNAKQFVNIAVLENLNKENSESGKGGMKNKK